MKLAKKPTILPDNIIYVIESIYYGVLVNYLYFVSIKYFLHASYTANYIPIVKE